MKATIDSEGCMGCGMCEQTAPEVFSFDGNIAKVICSTVAPHQEEAAKLAATQCPVNVIHIDA